MNCPSCGNEVFAGDPFCDSCGADLRNIPTATPTQAPSVVPPAASPQQVQAPQPGAAAPGSSVWETPPALPPPSPLPQVALASAPAVPMSDPALAPLPVVTPLAPNQPAPTPPMAPPAAPAGTGPRLLVKETGAVCPLPQRRDVIVGRTDPIDGIFPDLDLTAHDTLTGVSRRHAQLHEQGGQWFIRDLNSTNYTIVNRQRLQPDQDFLIEPGDEIRFGRLTMVFQV